MFMFIFPSDIFLWPFNEGIILEKPHLYLTLMKWLQLHPPHTLTSQSLGWVHTVSSATTELQHFPFIFNECKMQTSAVTDDRLNFLVTTLIML